MSVDVLPPTSEPVVFALADIWDSFGRHAPLIGQIKHYGLTITPADWAPWFVWDYGLEETVPYVRDLARVLAEGPTWQRRRGTPSGIQIGIGWVESPGVVDGPDGRHNWWEFQIGFEAPAADLDQIRQLDGIVRLSKASEDELFRMFSPAADFRPVRMDEHRADDGLMDGYSGTPLWEGGPLIAFGWSADSEIAFENVVHGGAEIVVSGSIERVEGLRFDEGSFGARPPALIEGFAEIEVDGVTDAFARDVWPTRWPRSWAAAAQPSISASVWETV